MGILSGPEIQHQVESGAIQIEPFHRHRLGPNSLDVCLGDELLVMYDEVFDLTKAPQFIKRLRIPPEGFVLQPGLGYLGHIIETVRGDGYVPFVDGRSSVGRAFLQVHQTAGRGDDGWGPAQFTLELMATYRPVRVYAGLPIAQVYFFKLDGKRKPYSGRYALQTGPTPFKPLAF